MPTDPTRLLVVDDEQAIRELLAASLRFAGFEVRTAGSGAEALRAAERSEPDLVLLDVMMPDLDGFEVVRRLRRGPRQIPVLFLTARDTVQDKITGLTLGGDDYVTKPFSLEEVIARVRAVLRRSGVDGGDQRPVLRYADLELDEVGASVHRAGQPVRLSPTEFKLLHYLMTNAGRVLSKGQILEQVWSYGFSGSDGVVESYISYLRRKIDFVEPRLIHTVRGLGYVLREQSW